MPHEPPPVGDADAPLRDHTDDAAGVDFAEMAQQLADPAAFPLVVSPWKAITVKQTHISMALLAGSYVYKVKKPLRLSYLDYSTPDLRRRACQDEIRLNARLAPEIYLGIAPVLRIPSAPSTADPAQTDAQRDRPLYRFGATFAPIAVPLPGAELAGGRVVDYAVVMQRLPEEATLAAMAQTGHATPDLLIAIARRIAAFHAACRRDFAVTAAGRPAAVRALWSENLAELQPCVGNTLDEETYQRLATFGELFLTQRATLLETRAREGRICEGHGDLRLEHIYSLGGESSHVPRITIIDCVEFSERLRCGDVANELAFLVMELTAAGRADLARIVTTAYVQATGDETLRELLPFYACYRACVRGKVESFAAHQTEMPERQREDARGRAIRLFDLAATYARGPTQPTALLVGGLMGSGKSTLAQQLRDELGWTLVASDVERHRLGCDSIPGQSPAPYGSGLYTDDWNRRTYAALRVRLDEALVEGRSCLLDASFARRADRQAVARVASRRGARVVFLECVCPPEIAVRRLADRWQARRVSAGENQQTSEGRPELYAEQRSHWESVDADEESALTHVVMDTNRPLALVVQEALSLLDPSYL
ncbi:MAG TPA: AAA family ATPase [Ktedonobacterales bacterium]|nr:AAA family ATPase [Ktedonobacterales bacterium]